MTRIERIFADFSLFLSIRANPPDLFFRYSAERDPRLSAFYFPKFKRFLKVD